MGKKGSSNKGPTAACGPQMSLTVREASTGKKQHMNAKSSLKLQHIKNLAMWASHDAKIPSLGAFFGHHFAASSEALATPVDPSLLTCQRCESILQPGNNCTIRIEKNKISSRNKSKKATNYPKNNIVYTCHYCSHRNMKRGTSKNTSQPKVKAHPNPKPTTSKAHENNPRGKMGIFEKSGSLEVKNDSGSSCPATPLTLLESKMKKRNRSGAKKTLANENSSEGLNVEKSSNRRRRKTWTSLKEIAENDNDNSKRLINLTIPFSM